jgi:hypothetical protein
LQRGVGPGRRFEAVWIGFVSIARCKAQDKEREIELREVMGRRRSIRFLNPHEPVEPEKIQMMFEASRIASHWGNVQSPRGVAVFRDSAPKEVVDELTRDEMFQAPAPLPWREAELEYLQKALNLEGNGLL